MLQNSLPRNDSTRAIHGVPALLKSAYHLQKIKPQYPSAVLAISSSSAASILAFQYCVARRYTTTAKYPGGRRTEQTYDIEGRMLSAEVGIRKTAQLNRITPFEEETMGERGLVTKSLYDAARNPLKVTYPDGSSVTNTYDANYSLPLTRDR